MEATQRRDGPDAPVTPAEIRQPTPRGQLAPPNLHKGQAWPIEPHSPVWVWLIVGWVEGKCPFHLRKLDLMTPMFSRSEGYSVSESPRQEDTRFDQDNLSRRTQGLPRCSRWPIGRALLTPSASTSGCQQRMSR